MLNLAQVRVALLDMDGVLYRGNEPLPGVNDLLALFAERGIAYACVTNNSTLTPAQYEAKLAKMGIAVPAEAVVTSSVATRHYLEHHASRGTRAYYIGMEGLREALFGDGYFVLDERRPEYVVVGLDLELTYAKLRVAGLAIRAGATFIGTNADATLPTEVGLVPGAGSILALLQTATGVEPLVIGKPQPTILRDTIERLGCTPEAALMIGDRFDTDIAGAHAAGARSALVLTGVETRESLAASSLQPDAVYADLPELVAAWRAA